MPEYKVKENHRIGKSVNLDLILDGVKVYDRYVSTDAWGVDPDEVAAELIAYWDKECAKKPEECIIPDVPIEVSMTSEAAIVKNVEVAAAKILATKAVDEQAQDKKIELESE